MCGVVDIPFNALLPQHYLEATCQLHTLAALPMGKEYAVATG